MKKHTYANERKSQGIRLKLQSNSTGLNEHLLVSPFQRDTIQKSQCKRKHELTALSNVIIHESEMFYLHRQQQQRGFNHDKKCVNRTHDLDNNMTCYRFHLT